MEEDEGVAEEATDPDHSTNCAVTEPFEMLNVERGVDMIPHAIRIKNTLIQ